MTTPDPLLTALLHIRRITLSIALITDPHSISLRSKGGIPPDHPFSPHPGHMRPPSSQPYTPWRLKPEGVTPWDWAEICRMQPPPK